MFASTALLVCEPLQLEKHDNGTARVIPVLLRHADWETSLLAHLAPLPRNRQPIKSWTDLDEAFAEVARDIRELLGQISTYSTTRNLQPRTTEQKAKQDQVTFLLNEASRLCQKNRHDQAIVKYQEALKLDPINLTIYKQLGTALILKKKFKDALICFRQGAELYPGNADIRHDVGVALMIQGELEEAASSFREALRLNPNTARTYSNLGKILLWQKKFKEASNYFRLSLSVGTNVNQWIASDHYELGLCLLKLDQVDEAVAEIEQAVQLESDNSRYQQGLKLARKVQNKKRRGILGILFGG